MTSIRLLAILAVLIAPGAAAAETADGGSALALAALVGNVSPLLAAKDRAVLMSLFTGNEGLAAKPGQKLKIAADKIACRSSSIDIAVHSCDLSLGGKEVTLAGRAAHELYATLIEIGVPPDGAAGSIYESLSALACVIDPGEVIQKAGGGAHCTYGPPD